MADLLKRLFNKKKKVTAASEKSVTPSNSVESEKPVARAKPAESPKPVASAKPAKAEAKAPETTPTQAPEAKSKRGGLGGFFASRKSKTNVEPTREPARYVEPKEDANSFFLDTDSAKTFGDIDYMRTSKGVRKTFPKTLGAQEGAEVFESTSSMGKMGGVADSRANAAKSSETPEIKPSTEGSDRRSRDTSMDMFRNMAKDIKR